MADADAPDPRTAFLQGAYGHDPVVDLQWPNVLPRGSAAMEQRGPWMRQYLEGLHPEYGKQVADFLASVMMAPTAMGPRGGVGAAALEHQAPNPAVTARMQRSIYDAPLNDIDAMRLAVQPVRHPDYAYTYGDRGPANMNPKGAPRDMLLATDRLDLSPGVRSTADILRDMRARGGDSDPANTNSKYLTSAELAALAKRGFLTRETFADKFDPVMRGVLRNDIYQGPDKPANANGPRTYGDALGDQRQPEPRQRMTIEDVMRQESELRRLLGLPESPPPQK